MKTFNNGCFYSVTCSRDDIRDFVSSWPCCGIPDERPITFQFEKSNGDLVDIEGTDYDGADLVALSEDAQRYGEKRMQKRGLMPAAALLRHAGNAV